MKKTPKEKMIEELKYQRKEFTEEKDLEVKAFHTGKIYQLINDIKLMEEQQKEIDDLIDEFDRTTILGSKDDVKDWLMDKLKAKQKH